MNTRNILILVGVAIAVGCIAVGVYPVHVEVHYAERINARSQAAQEIVATLDRIELAARAGDVKRLEASLTDRYLTELRRQVEQLGGEEIDGLWLHDAGSFLGDVREFTFRCGAGSGPRAIVVFSVGVGALAGHELRAFELDASSGEARLDRKLSRRLAADADPAAVAHEWLRELSGSTR